MTILRTSLNLCILSFFIFLYLYLLIHLYIWSTGAFNDFQCLQWGGVKQGGSLVSCPPRDHIYLCIFLIIYMSTFLSPYLCFVITYVYVYICIFTMYSSNFFYRIVGAFPRFVGAFPPHPRLSTAFQTTSFFQNT